MATCKQCGKPTVDSNIAYCVEHYLMLQQAIYLQQTLLATFQNLVADELDAGTGYMMRHPRMKIHNPPPFIGSNLTLNNIDVSGSTIGAINIGTIQNLDAVITVMKSQGDSKLSEAVTTLTKAIIENNKINDSMRNEIAEQLTFLSTQAAAQPQDRSLGVVKSVLTGLKGSISVAADLITLWDKAEPLFKTVFGIS